jgi:hypothetical protein
MKPALASEFSFSAEQIVEAARTWARFDGFEGDTCSGRALYRKSGKCGLTANVLAGGPGWFCVCGHYNMQSWSSHQMTHTDPDMGPDRVTLRQAYAQLDHDCTTKVQSEEVQP